MNNPLGKILLSDVMKPVHKKKKKNMYLYFLYNRIFFFFFIAKVETCVFFSVTVHKRVVLYRPLLKYSNNCYVLVTVGILKFVYTYRTFLLLSRLCTWFFLLFAQYLWSSACCGWQKNNRKTQIAGGRHNENMRPTEVDIMYVHLKTTQYFFFVQYAKTTEFFFLLGLLLEKITSRDIRTLKNRTFGRDVGETVVRRVQSDGIHDDVRKTVLSFVRKIFFLP